MPDFLQKTKDIQAIIQTKLEDRKKTSFLGESGAGLVRVKLNGLMDCLQVDIDPSLLTQEQAGVLKELVRGAFNEAAEKVKTDFKEDLTSSMGNLQNFIPSSPK